MKAAAAILGENLDTSACKTNPPRKNVSKWMITSQWGERMLPSALLQRSPASASIDNSSEKFQLVVSVWRFHCDVPVSRPRANINRNEEHLKPIFKKHTLEHKNITKGAFDLRESNWQGKCSTYTLTFPSFTLKSFNLWSFDGQNIASVEANWTHGPHNVFTVCWGGGVPEPLLHLS